MKTVEQKKKTWKGYLLLVTAAITCPCHLPIALAILGGTALGLFLRDNLLWIVPLLAIYFIWALFRGFKMFR